MLKAVKLVLWCGRDTAYRHYIRQVNPCLILLVNGLSSLEKYGNKLFSLTFCTVDIIMLILLASFQLTVQLTSNMIIAYFRDLISAVDIVYIFAYLIKRNRKAPTAFISILHTFFLSLLSIYQNEICSGLENNQSFLVWTLYYVFCCYFVVLVCSRVCIFLRKYR